MRILSLFALLLCTISPAAAQDRSPAVVSATPALRYPEVLKAAGVGGTVTARVVILPGDSVALDGVRIVSAPHPGFRNAVITGLRGWRYRGAIRGGRPVVDSIVVEVTYSRSGPPTAEFDSVAASEVRNDSGTVWRVSVGSFAITGPWETPPDSTWRAMGVRAMGKVLEEIQADAEGRVPIACVGLERFQKRMPVTATELQALQRPGIAVVVPERCPPAFESMAYVVGRVVPPGDDPVGVYAIEVTVAGDRWYSVKVEARGPTGGRRYLCVLDAADPTRPFRCHLGASWVS